MKKYSIALLMLLELGQLANAADVTISPPIGGGFSVKNNDGTLTRLTVSESGQIYIPTLPDALIGKSLCWNQTSGLLQACTETIGRDNFIPSIEISPQTLVSQSPTNILVSISDNVGLGWYSFDGLPITPYTDDIRINQSYIQKYPSPGESISGSVVIADSSGNIARKNYTFQTASTTVKFGKYNSINNATFPSDFQCTGQPMLNISSAQIESISIKAISFSDTYYSDNKPTWSTNDGFLMAISIDYKNSNENYIRNIKANAGILKPLDATTFPIDSKIFYTGLRNGYMTGEIRYLQTTPPRIQFEGSIRCDNYGVLNTGGVAIFTAELAP